MNKNKAQFFAQRNYLRNRIQLAFWQRIGDNKIAFAQPPIMQEIEEHTTGNDFIEIEIDQAQQLMDELWKTGVRPTEQGSAGQLAATERHLKDMQTIAFKLLGEKN